MNDIQQLQAILQELSVREIEVFASQTLAAKALAQRLVSNPEYVFDNAEKQVFSFYLTRLEELRDIARSLPTGYRLQDDIVWDKLARFLSNPESEPFPFQQVEIDTQIDTDFTTLTELLDLATEKHNTIEDEIESLRTGKPCKNYYQPGIYAMVKKYGLAVLKPAIEPLPTFEEPEMILDLRADNGQAMSDIEPLPIAQDNTQNSRPKSAIEPFPPRKVENTGLQHRKSWEGKL
ncbi:MAG TPA: hypothetical protein PKH77_01900 [Anaerolineae bacterium]|nr:hypothetical protein [Anaerolineae bacterium]